MGKIARVAHNVFAIVNIRYKTCHHVIYGVRCQTLPSSKRNNQLTCFKFKSLSHVCPSILVQLFTDTSRDVHAGRGEVALFARLVFFFSHCIMQYDFSQHVW